MIGRTSNFACPSKNVGECSDSERRKRSAFCPVWVMPEGVSTTTGQKVSKGPRHTTVGLTAVLGSDRIVAGVLLGLAEPAVQCGAHGRVIQRLMDVICSGVSSRELLCGVSC